MKDPYRAVDREMSTLVKDVDGLFNNTALRLPHDELNYPEAKTISSNLFMQVLTRVMNSYHKVAKDAIKDVRFLLLSCGYTDATEATKDLNSTELTDNLVEGYNELTGYKFDSEFERKKDRTTEMLVAYTGLQVRRQALKRSHDLVIRQIKQYGDLLIDETYYEAYRLAGVTRVMWITENDDKVCKTCRERGGRIYRLEEVPEKPHLNCRCHLRPIRPGGLK